jgi:hypothetical protein
VTIYSVPLIITDTEFGRLMVYILVTTGMRLEISRAVKILIGSHELQQSERWLSAFQRSILIPSSGQYMLVYAALINNNLDSVWLKF